MVPSYLNNSPAEARSQKVQRWRRFRRRLASYGYFVFVFSAMFAIWLLLSQLVNFILNLKSHSGFVVVTFFSVFAFRTTSLKQARRIVMHKRMTFMRTENVYILCQSFWLIFAVLGALLNPAFKQSANLFFLVLPIVSVNHFVFHNYRKHLKELEIRLAGFGAREEKLSIPDSGSPVFRESEQ